MNEQSASCPRESETVAATQSGIWSIDLQRHVTSCERCGSTQLAVSLLGRLATETHRLPHRLPDYRLLWIKAQFQQRQRLAHRFDILMLTGGCAIAALIAMITLIKWEVIAEMLNSMVSSSRSMQTVSPVTIVAIVACVVLVWILFVDRTSEHL